MHAESNVAARVTNASKPRRSADCKTKPPHLAKTKRRTFSEREGLAHALTRMRKHGSFALAAQCINKSNMRLVVKWIDLHLFGYKQLLLLMLRLQDCISFYEPTFTTGTNTILAVPCDEGIQCPAPQVGPRHLAPRCLQVQHPWSTAIQYSSETRESEEATSDRQNRGKQPTAGHPGKQEGIAMQ
jgi:hypothetical protein